MPYQTALTPERDEIARGSVERPEVRLAGPPLPSLFVHGVSEVLSETVTQREDLDRLLAAFVFPSA